MNISYKTSLLLLFIVVFIVGAVIIINNGRPINDLAEEPIVANETNPEPETQVVVTNAVPAPGYEGVEEMIVVKDGYTLADIAMHGTPEDCWASVSGGVYDLTTWVERHPGGSTIIKSLCGTDATVRFTNKHGESSIAKSALGLLKIGTLVD